MRAPVLVCGLGQVGYRVVSLLLSIGEQVTVVTLDAKPQWKAAVETLGARVIMGDARDEAVMEEAGLSAAKAVISCSSDDLTNIEVAIDCRAKRADLRIVLRVFDSGLAKNVESSLGVDSAFAMSKIAAPAFAEAALGQNVAVSFELGGEHFSISHHELSDDSPLKGKSPGEVERERGIRVLAHLHPERGMETPAKDLPLEENTAFIFGPNEAFNNLSGNSVSERPHPGTHLRMFGFFRRLWTGASPELRTVFLALNALVLSGVLIFWYGMQLSIIDAIYFVVTTVTTTGYGDITPREAPLPVKLFGILLMLVGSAMVATLYSIITDYVVNARLQQLVGKQRVPDKDHVVVAGLGNVGFRVVEQLLRKGQRVVVIEQDPNGRFVENVRSQAPVLVGDARDPATLLRAGVPHCAAVVAVTGDDAVNLSVGLTAANIAPKAKRILRIFDADFAGKVQRTFQFDASMSASRIAAPMFVAAALYGKSLAAFVYKGTLFALCSGESPKATTGDDFMSSTEVQINGINRIITIRSRALVTEHGKVEK